MELKRLGPALALGALVVCVSYTLQRLWDARSEPEGLVLATATIPYFWRAAAAALHGAVAGLVATFAPPRVVDRMLHPVLPWVLVPPCLLALLLVP